MELHLNFFGQGDCKDPLKTSESGNLSWCVQGTQDHCSLHAEALKIRPLKYCQHKSLRISRRNLNLGACLHHVCSSGQIIRKPLFLYTVLYLLCDVGFCCSFTRYKITLCCVCAYSRWASETELAPKYWAICRKILENVYTPSDTRYFNGVWDGLSCGLCLLLATVSGFYFLNCTKNQTLFKSPFTAKW